MLVRYAIASVQLSLLILIGQGPTARTAEISLIAATPTSAALKELGLQFERKTGHRLIAKFVSGPVVKREIDAGEPFDLAVSITPVIDELIKAGKIVADTRADIAYSGVGVGVRADAVRPDISTAAALRAALLEAKSVAHSAEGASGEFFRSLIERLGIAEEMRPKLRPISADRIARAVPSGEAEMIVVTMSVIAASEAQLVGPVPTELQFYNRFAAGISANAKEPHAAEAFLKLLVSTAAISAFQANGMEQGAPP